MIDPLLDIRDAAGRAVIGLCGGAAAYAMVDALGALNGVPVEALWIELWRALGYGVFGALFLLLALRPRRSAGVWEVSFLHKAALGVAALMLTGVPEASTAGPVDAALALATILAWALTRGWRSWSQPAAG